MCEANDVGRNDHVYRKSSTRQTSQLTNPLLRHTTSPRQASTGVTQTLTFYVGLEFWFPGLD